MTHHALFLPFTLITLFFCGCASTPTASPSSRTSGKKAMFTQGTLDDAQRASAQAFRNRDVTNMEMYWKDELGFLPCGFGRNETLGIQIRESDLVSMLGRPADLVDDPDGTRRMLYPLSQRLEGNSEITEYMVVLYYPDLTCRCLFEERQQIRR